MTGSTARTVLGLIAALMLCAVSVFVAGCRSPEPTAPKFIDMELGSPLWPGVRGIANVPVAPQWTIDGEQIVFVVDRRADFQVGGAFYYGGDSSDHGRIFVAAADGSEVQQLSPDDEEGFRHYYFSPAISPGGSQIAYSTSRYVAQVGKTFFGSEYRRHFEIEIANLDGSGPHRLTNTAPALWLDPYNVNVAPTWSPDGRLLSYVRDHHTIYGTNEPGVHTINVDGTGSKRIVSFGDDGIQITRLHNAPIWSPNGDQIAFVGRRYSPVPVPNAAGTGHFFPEESALYVVSSDNEEQQPEPLLSAAELLGFDSTLRGHALSAPAWTLDSNHLAVSVRQTKWVTREIVPVPGESGLYIINADGSGKRRVLEDVTGSHLQWSPDGLNLLVSNVMASPGSRDPQLGVSVVEFGDDWTVENIRTLPLSGVASWSPDGSLIAAWDSNAGVLVTVAADGTDRQIIAHDVNRPGVTAVPRSYLLELARAQPDS